MHLLERDAICRLLLLVAAAVLALEVGSAVLTAFVLDDQLNDAGATIANLLGSIANALWHAGLVAGLAGLIAVCSPARAR